MDNARRRRDDGMTLMELLVVCIIGSIVTGGLITLWFNLNKASAMTASQTEARDFARDGIARLAREIRDAEAVPGSNAILEAGPNSIAFTTTFNEAGNEVDTTEPRLVRYYLSDGGLHRATYAQGVTTYGDATPAHDDVVIPYTLNDDEEPLFSYSYVDAGGTPQPTPNASPIHEVATSDLSRLQLVDIRVIVDLDPGKAPNALEISTQAQIRNQRIVEN